MDILFEKIFAQLLFWIYDFLDTIGAIFNLLTGTQSADGSRSLLEIFVESAISTKVLIGLCIVSVVIAGACVGVKTVKNIVKIKAGGEPTSHATTIKQGGIAIFSSVLCIFFVVLFIAFSSMLLNMVNDVIAPAENMTLSQNLFNLSVEQCYVVDEDVWEERIVGDYYDESGNRVQEKDPSSSDGLAWEKDDAGEYVLDAGGHKIPVWVQQIERYHPYKTDAEGNFIVVSGWMDGYSAADIDWSMSPDEVFGVCNKDFLGLFEHQDWGYSRQPMVRLDSFNMFTAYLVAIIMLISMFMLSVGLVKRIYDIILLIFCMPLVCGTIPLDDGARFRAWRETFMSKVLVAFGAVLALNIFYLISRFITGPALDLTYLIEGGVLDSAAVTIFKMLMMLGGAMCVNASQTLIARILGTSADEGREAMQSFAMITSGVRMGAVGIAGVGRVAMAGSRAIFGGRNRYGRERTGLIPYAFRGVNAIGEKAGGENYSNSRGAAFVRTLGRMGNMSGFGRGGKNAGGAKQSGLSKPGTVGAINNTGMRSVRPNNLGTMRPISAPKSPTAFKSNPTGGKKR